MDNEEESFVARLSVLLDPQNDKNINKFRRELNQIPESRDLRWTFDKKGSLSKEMKKELNSMNTYMKMQTTKWNPFNWMKDKKQLQGLKSLYSDIQHTAITEMKKLQMKLDALNDPSNVFSLQNLEETTKASELALNDAKNRAEELGKKLEELTNKKMELKPTLSEQFLRKQINDTQKQMEKANKQLSTGMFAGDEGSERMKQDAITNAKSKSYMAMEMAIKYAEQNNDSRSYYDKLLRDINKQRDEHSKQLADATIQFNMSKSAYEQALQDLDDAQTAFELETDDDLRLTIQEQIQELEKEIPQLKNDLLNFSNQEYTAKVNLDVDDAIKRQAHGMWLNRARLSSGIQNLPEPDLNNKFKTAITKTHETQQKFGKDTDSKVYTEQMKQFMEEKLIQLQDVRRELQDKLDNTIKANAELGDLGKETEETKKQLKEANKEVKEQEKAHEQNRKILEQEALEAARLEAEIKTILQDLQGNPLSGVFNSPELQRFNPMLDKAKTKLSTFGGWAKSFAGKVVKRIATNIKSQVASFLNPLTNFRRAWDAWINRFDNKAIANTFEVIKYNLVTAIAPLLEKCANLALKFFAALNVFTKRWAGVDLFDKSAWELEQMKKGVGQLTASFDELHSNTDNPDQFNTLFDKGLSGDQLISPEWQKKLTEWAEGLEKIFGWILDHWKELVALWAAFKIAKGLWDLYKLFGGMDSLLGGLKGLTFGSLLSNLAIVAGAIMSIKALWDSIQWSKNWGGMLPDERNEQANKNVKTGEIGGALLGAGIGFKVAGLPGAAIGALIGDGMGQTAIGTFNTVVSAWHGDREGTDQAAKQAGTGIGKTIGTVAGTKAGIWAAAKLGAAIGTTFGPVGTAIGAVVGGVIGWAVGGKIGETIGEWGGKLINGVTDFFRGAGDFQRLKVTTEDVANAMQLAKDKTEAWNKELNALKELEKQTNESGEALYKSVENGEKSYWGLSDAQKAVYDQYVKVIDAEKEMKEARKQSLEYAAKEQEELAKETGNFKNYITTIQDGCKQGVISYEEMSDYFAQTYASLDEEGRKTFMEQLPKYMRDSVKTGSEQYITGWEKFKKGCGEFFSNFGQNMGNLLGDGIGLAVGGIPGLIISKFLPLGDLLTSTKNELDELKASADDLAASTQALNEAQDNQAKLEEQLAELTKGTDINAQQLYEDVNNGTKKWWDLTDAEKEVYDKYYDLQEAMKTTDECMKKNVDNMISIEWEAAKTSGNYQKFIGTLLDENKKGNLSTDEMQKKMSQAYAAMDKDARKTFLENIPEDMREGVKKGADEYLTGLEGFGTRLGKKLSEFGQAIGNFAKNTWNVLQSTGNWIAGKGFKTDEQIRQEGGDNFDPSKNKKIASYAVGTNYVPNDGLAYIHRGEAVIPAKYNKPYSGSNQNISRLENMMENLTRQVAQIGDIVNQGIKVQGQFVQRGADLVATVEKANNKLSNAVLNNKVYAR